MVAPLEMELLFLEGMDLQLFAGEKAEQATPKRRQEARKQGQVFQSRELASGLSLLGIVLVLRGTQHSFLINGEALITTYLGNMNLPLGISSVMYLYRMAIMQILDMTLPVLLASFILGLAGTLAQVGFVFSMEPISPKLSRINPVEGFKRMFSRRSLIQLLKDLFKLIIVGIVGYLVFETDPQVFPNLIQMDPLSSFSVVAGKVGDLALEIAIVFLILGAADYFYQRYEYGESLKMSKEEVKEERKEMEGQPEIKRRVRERQRRLALQRMMQAVPKADVIITNPTHYAVALSYRPGEMTAPKVVAKGQGFVAQRIREIAREAGVAIYPYPSLARDLYGQTEVGDDVPVELYQAVAEVLAFVYRLKNRSSVS